jgi:hypothetical protein
MRTSRKFAGIDDIGKSRDGSLVIAEQHVHHGDAPFDDGTGQRGDLVNVPPL